MRTRMIRSWAAVLCCAVLAMTVSAATPMNTGFRTEAFVRLTDPTTVTKCVIATSGDYAAVAVDGDRNMLYGIDASEPDAARQVCALAVRTSFSRTRLFMKGPHAFVGPETVSHQTSWAAGMRIDLSETTPAKQLLPIWGIMLAFDGKNMAVLESNTRGPLTESARRTVLPYRVGLMDMTDPTRPSRISEVATDLAVTRGTLIGRILLTDLATYDFSSAAAPFYKTMFNAQYAGVMGSIGVRGAPAFGFDDLAGGSSSDRAQPGTYYFPAAGAVAVDGGMAYLTVGNELYAIDITDPGAPGFMRGRYQLQSSNVALAAAGGRVFVYEVENHAVTVLRYTGDEPVFETKPDDAVLIAANIPQTVDAGEVTTVTLTLRNSGMGSWSDGLNYRLGVDDPGGVALVSYSRVRIAGGKAIAPGKDYTFNVGIKGPVGRYRLKFQMVHEFVNWFGPAVVGEIEITPAGVILQEK